jgi:hypothetical protein
MTAREEEMGRNVEKITVDRQEARLPQDLERYRWAAGRKTPDPFQKAQTAGDTELTLSISLTFS